MNIQNFLSPVILKTNTHTQTHTHTQAKDNQDLSQKAPHNEEERKWLAVWGEESSNPVAQLACQKRHWSFILDKLSCRMERCSVQPPSLLGPMGPACAVDSPGSEPEGETVNLE